MRESARDDGMVDEEWPVAPTWIGIPPLRLILAGVLMLALLGLPLTVDAQQTRVYRVGVLLHGGVYFQAIDGLRDGLRELGFEEGKQFVFLVHDSKGDE